MTTIVIPDTYLNIFRIYSSVKKYLYLYTCYLFNDAFSISDCMTLNVGRVMTDELEGTWKQTRVVYFKLLSSHLLEQLGKTTTICSQNS